MLRGPVGSREGGVTGMSRTSAVEEVASAEAVATPPATGLAPADGGTAPGSARVRALLTWFGVDPRGDVVPVDPDRPCGEAGCGRPALVGEELCPVHLGLVSPEELAATASARPRTLRALILAGLAAACGGTLALALGDPGFGWLGACSTAAVIGSLLARRAGRPLLASLLGTAGFFGASILVCAAALVAALAALPAVF